MLSIAPSTVFAPAAPEGEAGSPVLAAAVPLALAGVALAAGRIQRRPSLMVLAASFGALAASSCASLLAVDLAEGTARLLARTLGAALAFAHLGWLLLAAHGDPSGRPGHARRAAAIGAGAALAAAFVARAGMAPAAGAVPGWSTPLLAVPAALAYLAAGAMPLRTRRAGTARWLVAAGTALFAGAALASWLYPAGARAMQLAGLDALAAAAVVLGMLMAFLEDERAQAAAAAEALQNSHSQRLHSSKMEALGRMAGGVSHDFNNLLTAMRGHLELALERTLPADPRRVDLEQAWRAAERASELTRQLLSFSRARRVGANDCCDAVAVLREAEPLLHQLVGPSITIVTDLPSWAPPA
ncbi:MAG TPA: histidine kinase dimerization/phospho-acceptor domain-containing protein, partial [Planctomycetota bacterium]|nr:histidine kinase dimerization/phospho-acceptor domain-containing protein [Planctomycetota bacterium]